MQPDLVIDDVLADLGFRTDAAREAARAVLEAAGVTNPRKQRVTTGKLPAVKTLLAATFAMTCDRPTCRTRAAGSGKTALLAARPSDCAWCGGSPNRAAIDEAIEVLIKAGVHRVVVVGGSPATRGELESLVGDRLELRLVDGTARRTGRQAKVDLAWADLVLIWGGTELDHKVSRLYMGARGARVVTCPRRGIAALALTLGEFAAGGALRS